MRSNNHFQSVRRQATRHARKAARWTSRAEAWDAWASVQPLLKVGPLLNKIVDVVLDARLRGLNEIERLTQLLIKEKYQGDEDRIQPVDMPSVEDECTTLAMAILDGNPDVASARLQKIRHPAFGRESKAELEEIKQIYISAPRPAADLRDVDARSGNRPSALDCRRAGIEPPPPMVGLRSIASLTLTPRVLAQRPIHTRIARVTDY